VASTRTKTLVVYEDGKADSERVAVAIAERLAPERHEVLVKAASAVELPEILSSALYFFGADSPEAEGYAELARAFKGMNLAGRRAAFFGGSGSAVAWLRGICADTDVAAAHADLVLRKPDPVAVAAWIKGIA
jgi:predicted aconitase with swiveling domain